LVRRKISDLRVYAHVQAGDGHRARARGAGVERGREGAVVDAADGDIRKLGPEPVPAASEHAGARGGARATEAG
jgi:hypothetical protein